MLYSLHRRKDNHISTNIDNHLVSSFLVSYPLAGLLKRIPDSKPQQKNIFSIGISIFYLVGLFDLWDGALTLLVSSGGAYCIATFLRNSTYMPWIAFAFLMGHMSVSHIWRQLLNNPTGVDITGAQMVLVMKLSAFCWNVADGQLPEEELSDFQKDRMLKEVPSVVDFTGYVLFFPALFAGPAFDYAEYRRWIDTTMFDLPAQVDPAKKPPVRKKRRIPRSGTPATLKALTGLLWIGLFMWLSGPYSHEHLVADSFMTYGVVRRVWMLYMTGLVARFKYYGVWSLTEGACILAGLGYAGVDPVTGKVAWNRLQNIDPWQVETAQNARGYLSGWNMNTNNWLRNYVYLRVTPRGKKPGFRASMITFGTSALWHGFYPGYYLTFLLASLIQTAAKHFRRHVRPFFMDPLTGGPSSKKWIYDSATYVATQLTFAFAVCPFLILSMSDSLRVWARVYFYGLLWTIAALIFFASPGKAMLRRQLEKRHGRASARMVRTISTESMSGGHPILGISKDPEGDITEALGELRAEVEAREKQAKNKSSEKERA
ncbi:Lysophospholipid acyltransferase [Emericellopsis cladophorae]|uniref:Lysophospholipid acyltransferase n=1 Tax=Emericellopsis cladophorae TaxID=2686198 RepID=A0A9Q0BB91_9HYPO|nr:Lysophospholipid acyltransferase [Emericellopsis cladophorae]KAI6778250.1 Lysophospholipid acyltransferase [Emericellopsis cladophorae]